MTADLDEVKSTFAVTFEALRNVCSRKSFLGFLCLASLIDYLSKLAYGTDLADWKRYIEFINEFFPSGYKRFQYRIGKKDLPEQMYYVLRNGMVHSFSLIPDEKGRNMEVEETQLSYVTSVKLGKIDWRTSVIIWVSIRIARGDLMMRLCL